MRCSVRQPEIAARQCEGQFRVFRNGRTHAQFAAALRARGIDTGRAFPPTDEWARISIVLPAENAQASAAVEELLK